MFRVIIKDPLWNDVLGIFDQFTHFEYCNKLSNIWTAKLCISCECKQLSDFTFKRMWLKNRVEIYCLNQGSENWWKVFDWYLHDSHVTCDEICIEVMDCIWRLDRRRLRSDYKRTNVTAQQVVNEVRWILNWTAPMEVTLWNIQDPTVLAEVSYTYGKSFLDILQDLAKRTGAEFRVCDCKLEFVLPNATNPDWTGTRLEWEYQYNVQNDNSVITDFIVSKTLKNFCNVKLSQDSDNTTTHGERCDVIDQPSVDECGVWECYESNPEWHNFMTENECNELPQIKVDASCDNWCDIKVGDRKSTIITPKTWLTYRFDAIFLELCVKCEGGDFDIQYNLWSSNSLYQRFQSDQDRIRELEWRLETLEQNQ